jgi:hypothetical protein
LLDRGVQVLLDALSIEDVAAFSLNSVLCDIITDTTESSLANVLGDKFAGIVLATNDEVRVAGHLSHTSESVGA